MFSDLKIRYRWKFLPLSISSKFTALARDLKSGWAAPRPHLSLSRKAHSRARQTCLPSVVIDHAESRDHDNVSHRCSIVSKCRHFLVTFRTMAKLLLHGLSVSRDSEFPRGTAFPAWTRREAAGGVVD